MPLPRAANMKKRVEQYLSTHGEICKKLLSPKQAQKQGGIMNKIILNNGMEIPQLGLGVFQIENVSLCDGDYDSKVTVPLRTGRF